MFAVVKTGGKQYRVTEGDKITIEKLETEEGQQVTLGEVLMLNEGNQTKIGTPTVDGAKVLATVESNFKGRKVIVFKKKRRHNYRRKKGHRQNLTTVTINKIVIG